MKKKILILTEKNDWFYIHAKKLSVILQKRGYKVKIADNHLKIKSKYSIVFMLSYYRIVDNKFLSRNDHNIVIHESNLPKGKGWAPLFWQIIEGKNIINFTVFEVDKSVDGGDYYFKEKMYLKGHELYHEIRDLQAKMRIKCCLKLMKNFKKLKLKKQRGTSTYYRKRGKGDAEININKTIKSQFNLLRSVDNNNFPAFFNYKNNKYIIKISKVKN